MSDALQSQALKISVSSGHLDGQWDVCETPTNTPGSISEMVALQNSVIALFAVQLRRHFSRAHSAVITPVFAASTTYRVTVNATNVDTVTAASNLAELLQEIADALNANGTVAALATAYLWDDDGDGINDSVILVSDNADLTTTFTTRTTITAGTGTISCKEDPSSATATITLYRGGTSKSTSVDERPTAPVTPSGYGGFTVDWRGFAERLPVGSFDYGFIHLEAVTYPSDGAGTGEATADPRCFIAPNLDGPG